MSVVDIRAGTLHLDMRTERLATSDLLAFASRENPVRPFLFVSKVLGKHWPCRPHVMRGTYDLLADGLADRPGPMVLIGLAETATGLGHGVYDSLVRRHGRGDAMYSHTTRHPLRRRLACVFDESHSHAAQHLVYEPGGALRETFDAAQTLVLVDDEISTGRTLCELARGYVRRNPGVRRVVLATLVSWLGENARARLEEAIEREVEVVALATGSFRFEARRGADTPFPEGSRAAVRPGRHVSTRFGRVGVRGVLAPPRPPRLPRGAAVAVVGTGEFAFAPFRLAEVLEEEGRDVLFQSTSRSPVALGDAIASRLVFDDHHGEGVVNYLYNRPTDPRVSVVGYEHPSLAAAHGLAATLGAVTWSPRASR